MNSNIKKFVVPVISWCVVVWICRVFLTSIPYKFTNHPDTQHIFGTIGDWMGEVFFEWLGAFFTQFGPYIVGSFEILTSLVLIAPAVYWILGLLGLLSSQGVRQKFHQYGGLMASAVMTGAVFFHLFTPLGVEVLHEGESDGGSLFYAAVSIAVLGIVLFLLNRRVAD
ncbi:MAG: hypothetical protein OXD44_10420 [Gammaproteobacteria bacterium]|nr:hypothetical protein [Gammaproteobacteria bacterium]MCY4314082.1 hypothetical protein [Gammaproteobacteria bacterium]